MSTTSSMEETMKDLLDRGEVKPSWRDKQFVHFLDLKEAYGREFLARVKEHAESTGFSWADLAKFENERRTCAQMFVDKFGMTYWGTPTNRQKYLQEECLDDPDTLCVYPDRRDEIVRTIMVLLERKAKAYARMSTEKPKPLAPEPAITGSNTTTAPIRTPTPEASKQAPTASSIPQKRPNSNPNPKSKRKQPTLQPRETDEDYNEPLPSAEKPTYKIPRTRAISNAIRPFKSFLTESESEAELETASNKIQKPSKSKKKLDPYHHRQQQQNPAHHPKPSSSSITTEETPKSAKVKRTSVLRPPPPPPPMGTFIHQNPTSSTTTTTNFTTQTKNTPASPANYTPTTIFLTTATNQVGMAPVWIPYEEFTSTSAFLEYMADQCNLVEWNPTAQLSREDTALFASSSPADSVIAASVRFDWSDFEIRVRQGHNEDWVIVQRELVRAWRVEAAAAAAAAAAEVGGDEGIEVRDFRIRVLLHVLG